MSNNAIEIPETYRDGTPVREGDIIAEGKVGDIIWEGKAKVITRPLGVVYIGSRKKLTKNNTILDKPEFYNVMQIRDGKVKLIEDNLEDWAEEFISKTHTTTMSFHLSKWDGGFYGWEDIYKVGSIYDFGD